MATCVEYIVADDLYEMEFLHRVDSLSNLKWRYPSKNDKDKLKKESIISCAIDGDWDISAERNMTYTLRNHEVIEQLVKKVL